MLAYQISGPFEVTRTDDTPQLIKVKHITLDELNQEQLREARLVVIAGVASPGDSVPLHTHQWHGVSYLLSWSDFVRRDEFGVALLNTRESGVKLLEGTAVWQDTLGPHTLENVGDSTLRVVTVEMKHGH